MLDERKSEIVRAVVEEHIRTGEPVSSRATLEVSGLSVSPATVRNDLAALEAEGYVVQPHTSAGRIPTALAFRYYVDHLSPKRLRRHNQARIAEFFSSVHLELGRLLKSTTSLLSEITRYPAVVTSPGHSVTRVSGAHLVQVSAESLLVVLVGDGSQISQEVISLTQTADPADIEAAERIVRTLLIQSELDVIDVVDAIPPKTPKTVRLIVESVVGSATHAQVHDQEVYVRGTGQMAGVWEDLNKVQSVLEILEREAALLELLASMPVGTAVQIGRELGLSDDADVAMVSTSYDVSGETTGRLGVIGPMRMDYGRAISAVEKVGDGLGESLTVSDE